MPRDNHPLCQRRLEQVRLRSNYTVFRRLVNELFAQPVPPPGWQSDPNRTKLRLAVAHAEEPTFT